MTIAVLLIHQTDGTLREVVLQAAQTTLGRAPECDIALEGRLISRQHARIQQVDRAYVLEDLGSHNGTTLNGTPLTAPHVLHDGDQIELAGVARLVFVDSDATNTRPLPAATGIWLDQAAQDVWVNGQCLSPRVSPAQFSLLQLLLQHADQICARDQIVAAVWPDARDGVSDEALDALIKRVRARLAEVPGGQSYLVTLRGRGLLLRSAPEHTQRETR